TVSVSACRRCWRASIATGGAICSGPTATPGCASPTSDPHPTRISTTAACPRCACRRSSSTAAAIRAPSQANSTRSGPRSATRQSRSCRAAGTARTASAPPRTRSRAPRNASCRRSARHQACGAMTAIEFDGVCRDFATPDGRPYRALDAISFAVSAGSFVAIVGPSGCGKSTLLNIAAGLLTPSSGSVRVDGAALAGLNRRATYMFQQDALLPWKTVRDNVALGLTLDAVPRPEAQARANEWLARVGLGAFAEHYPAQLSG